MKLVGKETKSYQDYPSDYKAVLKQWEESGTELRQKGTPGVERQSYAFVRTSLFDAETQKLFGLQSQRRGS
jgi:hypothetical protein